MNRIEINIRCDYNSIIKVVDRVIRSDFTIDDWWSNTNFCFNKGLSLEFD